MPINRWRWISIYNDAAAAAAKSLQSCPTLCDPTDSSPLGSSVPGILQARILEWVAISFSNAWKWKVKMKSLSRVRLSDPMDCSLLGSSVHGIFQARVLEWGAIAFSNVSLLNVNSKIFYSHRSFSVTGDQRFCWQCAMVTNTHQNNHLLTLTKSQWLTLTWNTVSFNWKRQFKYQFIYASNAV